MLEDYVPEADWGEIKYFYKDRLYKIFYGGDLSNPYDYYYSFEIIHKSFEKYYDQNLPRSPFAEFSFCLYLQDRILNGIDQEKPDSATLSSGHIEVPSEMFWRDCNRFLDEFDVAEFCPSTITSLYTLDIDKLTAQPDIKKFMDLAFNGLNCPYFFIKHGGKYYPVLPRKFFSVLYDAWGRILRENYGRILEVIKTPKIDIGIELCNFVRERIEEKEVFAAVSPLDKDRKALDPVFAFALHAEDKLFLFTMLPPPVGNNVKEYLNDLNGKLKAAQKHLSRYPTSLRIWPRKQDVEFRSEKERVALTPVLIAVLPSYLSCEMLRIKIPKDFPALTIGLDQILGIIDEITDEKELVRFFEFLEQSEQLSIPPLTSYLDKFGAFKDSHSVLVAGAKKPDMMVLDLAGGPITDIARFPSSGANFRK